MMRSQRTLAWRRGWTSAAILTCASALLALEAILAHNAGAAQFQHRGTSGQVSCSSRCGPIETYDQDSSLVGLGTTAVSTSCAGGDAAASVSIDSEVRSVTLSARSQVNQASSGTSHFQTARPTPRTEWDVISDPGDCPRSEVWVDSKIPEPGIGLAAETPSGSGLPVRYFVPPGEGSAFAFGVNAGSYVSLYAFGGSDLREPGFESADALATISLRQPPHASMAPSFRSGSSPLDVIFSNFSCGLIDQYSWDFGDGQTSDAADPPTVTYNTDTCEEYVACLTASGPDGPPDTSNCYTITVENPGFMADFSYEQENVAEPSLRFSDESGVDDTFEQWWKFGDGTGWMLSDNPTHIFPVGRCQAESFDVTHYIDGFSGSCTSETTLCVSVQNDCCADGVVESGEECLCEDLATECVADPTVCAGIGHGTCEHRPERNCSICGNGEIEVGEECDEGSLCDDLSTDCTGDPAKCVGIGDESCAPRDQNGCDGTCKLMSYVPLGDSFASGEGTFNYFPSSSTKDNQCHRARDAYAAQLSFDGMTPVPLQEEHFLACSGARTVNVGIGGSNAKSRDDAAGTQLDRSLILGQDDPKTVNSDTDLVTVSIGGNDAGFTKTLLLCARSLTGCDAVGVQEDVADWIDQAAEEAAKVYSDIGARLGSNLDATVLVVGYPQILPAEIDPVLRHNCHLAWAFYDDEELSFIGRATSRLNSLLCAAAKAEGLYFVDIEAAFSGHAACSPDPWLNGLLFRLPLTLHPPFVQTPLRAEAFHPSSLAHARYADAINAGLVDLAALESAACPAVPSLVEAAPRSSGLAESPRASVGDLEVALSPPSACETTSMYVPGHGLRIVGDGFSAGGFVLVRLSTFGAPYAAELGTLEADAHGTIDGVLFVPHGAPVGELGLIEAHGARADGGSHLLIAQVGSAPSAASDFDFDGALDLCDNCPLVPNDQTDLDDDGIGDACDSCPDDPTNDTCQFVGCGNGLLEPDEGCDDGNIADGDGCSAFCEVGEGYQCSGQPSVCEPLALVGEVLLEKATAWRTRSKPGRLSLKGTFQTGPLGPGDVFDPELGIDVVVMDGVGMNVGGALDPGDCSTNPQNGKVRCRSSDRSVTASFIPSKASPGEWRFKLFLRGHDIERPQAGPISLQMQNGDVVRRGSSSDCRTAIAKLVCKR